MSHRGQAKVTRPAIRCRSRAIVPGIVILGLLAIASTARAHPLDLGYLRVDPSGDRIKIDLDLDLKAAEILLGHAGMKPESIANVDAAAIRANAQDLAAQSFASAPITTAAGPCTWGVATAELTDRTVKVTSTATCPGPGERRWTFPFVHEERVSSKFELLVKETVAGSERLTLVDKTKTEIVLGSTSTTAPTVSSVGFTDFVWSGIEHIGVAPDQWRERDGGLKLPDGIDHILFLLALMLGGGTLLQLVGIASGFTLGHSITLALAALDIVRAPLSVIEPLIALSIALAAVEAYVGKWPKHRWKIAMGFGLIHGFGFATALTHLELTTRGKVTALFGYNIGVELGQVVVVLVVAPLVLLAYRNVVDRRATPLPIKLAASAIFVAGMYWFVQRLTA